MADEVEQPEGQEKKKKEGLGLPMILGIIVGFLILQIVAIYFIFTVFLKPAGSASDKEKKKEHTEKTEESDAESGSAHEPRYIVPVKCGEKEDIIINPRGSSAHYVVVGVGLEVDDEEKGKEVEKVMIPFCDRITSTFSAQTLEELQDPSRRDSLRIIIKKQLQPFMGEVKLRNVYFSRFLIQ